MADSDRRLNANVPGPLFVDDTCIDCGVCRHFAPDVYGDTSDAAYVAVQPASPAQWQAALRGLLSCPVASIGLRPPDPAALRAARATLPFELAGGVFVCGFNHRASYGAHSYLLRAESGNWLVEAPRFVQHLVRRIEELGGLRWIFLTHRDDVGDAAKFAAHFGAQRIIHARERDAQPDAEIVLDGETFAALGAAQPLFTPGHTEGHMVLLWQERFLLTGDHVAWSRAESRLRAFPDYCWYSWEEQIRSMQRLRALDEVEWVLPGHGMWHQLAPGHFPAAIDEVVAWMRAAA